MESLNISGQTISDMYSGYISTDISWIPVAGSSVYIYSIPLPSYNFTPLEPVFFDRIYPIPWLAYLSSLKLLLLKPPNTPFKSLPTTQNTSNTIIISPISLTFIVLTIIKIQIITEKQIYDPDYLKILSGATFICSVLFRVLFDTRTAGLATIKFYAIFIEYAPNRTFAAKTACSPNVIERMPVDIHIHDCLISFSFR